MDLMMSIGILVCGSSPDTVRFGPAVQFFLVRVYVTLLEGLVVFNVFLGTGLKNRSFSLYKVVLNGIFLLILIQQSFSSETAPV